MIDNGHRAHSPEPYLNSRPTGAAIAAALGYSYDGLNVIRKVATPP